MIKAEYVSYESAKLLKEEGFPQEGFLTYYNENGTMLHSEMQCAERYARCTKYQAMRWLREDRHIFVEISYDNGFGRPPYYVEIKILPEGDFIDDISYPMAHTSYEAAAEAGIQATCKYLLTGQ